MSSDTTLPSLNFYLAPEEWLINYLDFLYWLLSYIESDILERGQQDPEQIPNLHIHCMHLVAANAPYGYSQMEHWMDQIRAAGTDGINDETYFVQQTLEQCAKDCFGCDEQFLNTARLGVIHRVQIRENQFRAASRST